MAKKKENTENQITLNYEGKEYKFDFNSLTREAQAEYRRANEIATDMLRVEQQMSEKRWLLNKYISFVTSELDLKDNLPKVEENKDVDSKEGK